jgi:hypothetical protein
VVHLSTGNQLAEALTTGRHRRKASVKEDGRTQPQETGRRLPGTSLGHASFGLAGGQYKTICRAAPRKLRQPRPSVALPVPESRPRTTCQTQPKPTLVLHISPTLEVRTRPDVGPPRHDPNG